MKTRTIVEDVSGSLNCRYFAEIDDGDELKVRREGDDPPEAARKIVSTLRCKADAAERMFIESGVLPPARAAHELDPTQRARPDEPQRASDERLREMAEAGESCVRDGVDAVLDGVSSRGLGEMARELLNLRHESRPAVELRQEVEQLRAKHQQVTVELNSDLQGADELCDATESENDRLRAENKRLLDETARHESQLGGLAEIRRGDADGFRELLGTMRTALAEAVQEIDAHNAEYKHVTSDEKLDAWRRLSSPDGEGMPAIFARLDAIGADPDHPIQRFVRGALERKVNGPDAPHAFVEGAFQPGDRGHQMPDETCAVCGRDPRNSVHGTDLPAVLREDNHAYKSRPRMLLEEVGEHLVELVTMLAEKVAAVGVRRLVVSEELGLRLGVTPETPASLMTPCGVVWVFADRDVKKELTKGLLDALGLSMNMVGTHVVAAVDGLPGLNITIRTEAARELHLALGVLLGEEGQRPSVRTE